MKEKIEGEIVPYEKRNIQNSSFIPRHDNKTNIHLHKDTYNQHHYNIHQNFTTNTTTTTTTYNNLHSKYGFFGFIISVLIFPFKLIYDIFKAIWKKYDLNEKLKIERQKIRIMKLRKKIVSKQKDNWNMDEIY